jgi:RNA polymerase sigma-70 factor (ECF subfamily)
MAAEGDLKNALAKVRRRREDPIDVELVDSGGNERVGQLEAQLDVARIRPELESHIPDHADRKAVELMLDEERSTSAFADVWALGHLSPEERRKEVKRRKDRLKKTLQRLGQALRQGRR